MDKPSGLQPGWYPDPSGSCGRRYWDGNDWTAHAPPRPGGALWARFWRQPLWKQVALIVAGVFIVGLSISGITRCSHNQDIRHKCEAAMTSEGYKGAQWQDAVDFCVKNSGG